MKKIDPSKLRKIDEVAKAMAPSFAFGIYDEDDIYQEAVILGIECLDRHDPSKSQLKTFLYTHIRNRLINLKRKKLRTRSPCISCVNKDICDDKTSCKAFTSWEGKQKLLSPTVLSDRSSIIDKNSSDSQLDLLIKKELFEIVDKKLPVEYRKDYMLFIDGVSIPKKQRLKLIEILSEILKEWQDEENPAN